MKTTSMVIGSTDIIFQDYEIGKGKIIISDSNCDYNFSYYWGAMGKETTLKQFILEINSDYFINKLAYSCMNVFNAKFTFANIRRYIKESMEYELPWYKHMEFQKDMREKLNEWQNEVHDERHFIESWEYFFEYTLNYYLIDCRHDMRDVKESFRGITEHWNFIGKSPSKQYYWLEKLHKKIKRQIQQNN